MKSFIIILLLPTFFYSCSNSSHKPAVTDQATVEKLSYFPLTSYLKGQVRSIALMNVNPLKTVTTATKTDSSWIKMEDFGGEVAEFMSPEIDSLNMTGLFSESKFNDQTLGNVTLTYEPKKKLPDGFELARWDVYINPKTGTITKAYMLKNRKDTTLHLTWESAKGCTIQTVINKTDGTAHEESKVSITWNF